MIDNFPIFEIAPPPWRYDDLDMTVFDAAGLCVCYLARPRLGAYNADIVGTCLVRIANGGFAAEDLALLFERAPTPWRPARLGEQFGFTYDSDSVAIFTILRTRGDFDLEHMVEVGLIEWVNALGNEP